MSKSEIVRWFEWAYQQAQENLGAHTGGPNEADFRKWLKYCKRALQALKKAK